MDELPSSVPEESLPFESFAPVLEIANAALVPVVKSLLDLAEIHYFISAERAQDLLGWGRIGAGYNIVTGAPTVYVEPSRAIEARELLADLDADNGGDSESEAAHQRAASLARKWFEAWTAGELASLPLASDFQRVTPFGVFPDPRSYLTAVKRMRRESVPEIVVRAMLVQASQVVVRYDMRIANETVEACDWIRIRGDEIVEVRSFYDTAKFRTMYDEEFVG